MLLLAGRPSPLAGADYDRRLRLRPCLRFLSPGPGFAAVGFTPYPPADASSSGGRAATPPPPRTARLTARSPRTPARCRSSVRTGPVVGPGIRLGNDSGLLLSTPRRLRGREARRSLKDALLAATAPRHSTSPPPPSRDSAADDQLRCCTARRCWLGFAQARAHPPSFSVRRGTVRRCVRLPWLGPVAPTARSRTLRRCAPDVFAGVRRRKGPGEGARCGLELCWQRGACSGLGQIPRESL